jgi:gliding motility-associated-like protein
LIQVKAQGGTPDYQYRLGNNPFGGDSIFQKLSPGSYPITVQDRSGCWQKSTVVLPPPVPLVANYQTTLPRCVGEKNGTIELSGSRVPGLSFRWSNGDTTANLRNLAPGSWLVTITDLQRGCTLQQTFNLPSPTPLNVGAKLLRAPGCDSTGNAQGSAEVRILGGKGPFKILWSNGDTSRTLSIATAGLYRVSISDANGCRHLDSIIAHKMTVDLQLTPNNCAGDKKGGIRIQVRGGLPDYRIKVGNGDFGRDSILRQLSGGKYKISVLDQSGCLWSKTVSLPDPPLFSIQLPKDTVLKMGASLVLRAQANERLKSFLWKSDQKEACTTCPELSLTRLLNSQLVSLSAISQNNCTASATLRITIQKDYHVYIPNAFSPNGDDHNAFFELFLGPNAERVRTLEIFTRWGEKVFSFDADNGGGEPKWDGFFRGSAMANEVLVYKAEVDFIDGERKQFAGSLVLVR